MHSSVIFSLLFVAATPLPEGKSSVEIHLDTAKLRLFTYKPKDHSDGPLLMVFHGVLRNAEEYRDDSVDMGNRFRALIVAPLFDKETFPKPRYQFGGIVRDGLITPHHEWTGEYVNRITKFIREREGRPQMPLYLIGHSGGGQFLNRLSAFVQTDAKRIVVANAGTYLFPNREAVFPFGLGGLPEELQSDEQLKFYLSQPVTIYLGEADTERDPYLDVIPEADAQGRSRYERGRNVFKAAKTLAGQRRWPFAWKLVIAEGVEHDHSRMFNAPDCSAALELP